jgi:hypothetical protein
MIVKLKIPEIDYSQNYKLKSPNGLKNSLKEIISEARGSSSPDNEEFWEIIESEVVSLIEDKKKEVTYPNKSKLQDNTTKYIFEIDSEGKLYQKTLEDAKIGKEWNKTHIY